jgi:hypothetical protein
MATLDGLAVEEHVAAVTPSPISTQRSSALTPPASAATMVIKAKMLFMWVRFSFYGLSSSDAGGPVSRMTRTSRKRRSTALYPTTATLERDPYRLWGYKLTYCPKSEIGLVTPLQVVVGVCLRLAGKSAKA